MRVVAYAQSDGRVLVLDDADGPRLPGAEVPVGDRPSDVAATVLSGLALQPTEPPDLLCVLPSGDGFAAAYACVVDGEPTQGRWADPEDLPQPSLDAYTAWRERRRVEQQVRRWRLTCDMFVVRDDRMLVLQRAGNLGAGLWYVPGGIAEPREDPLDAAVRETHEETGLTVERPELLRVWSYVGLHDLDAIHATYMGHTPSGEVVLSEEHSDHDWVQPRAFLDGYWADLGAKFPDADFIPQVRKNVELLIDRLGS